MLCTQQGVVRKWMVHEADVAPSITGGPNEVGAAKEQHKESKVCILGLGSVAELSRVRG